MNETHLRRAIALAAETAQLGNKPFGAVLVSADGTVLAEGYNEVSSTGDVTAHAEIAAIRAAATTDSAASTANAVMYASGEPCPMCSAAMVLAGISRIVFGASQPEFSKILVGGPQLNLRCADIVAAAEVEISVEGPVLEDEALAAMR